jgi:predicted GNAT family N-acyltransferase
MYIYNVTINIDETIHKAWLHWMKTEHIPAMLDTGKFSKALMTRVLVEEEMDGITYSVQYMTDSKETLQKYYAENAATLRAQSKPFEGKFVAFRTELEVVSEQ